MIKARSMMTKDVITISPSSGMLDAARLATSKSVSSLVVVEKGIPIAVISESDIIKGVLSKKKVRDVMSKNFLIISPETSFYEISKAMRGKGITRFPVVEEGRLAGLVTETDILGATRDFTRMHQVIQDIILGIFGIATAFFLLYFSPLKGMLFG